jgi:hypothetical protein
MHLGIIELYEKNHHSLIYNWIRVAEINNWDITIYIREDLYIQLEKELSCMNFRLVICKGGRLKNIRRIKKDYKNSSVDQLLFLSLTGNIFPFLFSSFFNIDYGITIHNANVWFVKNVIRKPRHLIKRFVRHRLKKNANFFVVNSGNMKNYIGKNVTESRSIFVMPFSLKKSNHKAHKNVNSKNLTVAYPGSINIKRKSYDKFLHLAQDNPKDRFILLGSPDVSDDKNESVIKKAKAMTNVVAFEKYLSINCFNEYLRNTDILFSEINLNYKISDMSEIYGITKDSGISYLMAEFMIPALLNDTFNNIPEVSRGTIAFKGYDHLKYKFGLCRDYNKRASLVRKMKNDLKSFTAENHAKKIKQLENIN